MARTFADKAIQFFLEEMEPPEKLPLNVQIMNPYFKPAVQQLVKKFFKRFYNDQEKRVFIFGINPGRFGGGITGIAFTDPVALKEFCGIENELGDKRELSSRFVYTVIEAFGGAEKFYDSFYITALFPMTLVKDGKNFNYYDSKKVWEQLKSQVVEAIKTQMRFGAKKSVAISLGKKSADYLKSLNDEHGFFGQIEVLDHPRYIMQYKRKELDDYIEQYLTVLRKSLK